MSKYDTNEIKTFDNEVLETLIENKLTTKLNMEQFAHADYSLAENAGMKKKIRKYVGSGNVQELGMGEGNTESMGSSFSEVEYEVGTTQGRVEYYDEQLMNDPVAIEAAVGYTSVNMVNDMTKKIVAEFQKTSYKEYGATFGFNAVSDAIASFPDEETEGESLFLLINRGDATIWRKNLKDDLKYVEAFVRTGYVGHVCGVPIYTSDAIPAGKAFLATAEAVTIFVKKGVGTETERDANTRLNKLFIRKVMLVALTNEKKIIEITTAADPRTGYTVLAEAPSDWATAYNNYFTYDAAGEQMVKNAFTAAPEFEANKYFKAN